MRLRRNFVHPVYGECCSHRPGSMPRIFTPLAAYNRRVSQGVSHEPEYVARMEVLQALFDKWSRETSAW